MTYRIPILLLVLVPAVSAVTVGTPDFPFDFPWGNG